jgi:DNA mismatch repair protein MutS
VSDAAREGRAEGGGERPGRQSALLAQYLRIKAQHQHAILLFRLGDFYEMFFADAEVAARDLDLTLTARNRGDPDEVPLCGFPAHAAQPYVARLLARGHTVAICEQQPAPRGRGLMEREVVRIVTPGTILEEESLEPGAPSLLAALAGRDDRFGIAVIDFATGAFRATEGESWLAAREELERLGPRELLLAPDLPPDVAAACADPRMARPWATAVLPEPVDAGGGLPPLAARAAGGALAYVDATYRRRPAHLRPPEPYALAGFVRLDAATRRNLELLQTLGGERRGSLLWVLDQTATPMGARRLREWLLYPLLDPAAIGRRLDAVEELVERPDLRAALRASLDGVGDLERLAARVGARTAGPRDLSHLAAALGRTADLLAALAPARSDLLDKLTGALDPLPDVATEIAATLVDAPPPHTRLPGFIRAGRHPEVDELREVARDAKGWLARFEAAERTRTGIPSLKVRHNRVFGYYVEVTRPNLPLVPQDYERKQTLVGAERFVTAALKEHEARVLGAEERLRGLEAHVFETLLDAVAARQPTLVRTAEALATLDAVAALAETAHHRGYVRPAISRATTLRVRAGRHPVVEAVAGGGFVPNDTQLDPEAEQVFIVTGPNMGGKSTYLRQVALITLLAQIGSFVPAAEAEVGLVDRIFTRIGASDNLIGGESTFMVEMRETALILAGLTPRSLVILDEIGRGTSTFDGISIAWAVAEHLHDAPERPRTLFATHYHELTALAAERTRVRNVSVGVAEWKGEIVFLRQIVPGPSPRSYGVDVARLAGVPPPVVARARALLAQLERGDGLGARSLEPGPVQQLPLFSRDGSLRRELAAIEPDRVTPLEALAILARLAEAARRGPG